MGQFLRNAGIRIDAVYSSPLVRARETAEIVCSTLGGSDPGPVRIVDALRNETTARQFDGWVRALPRAKHVLLVGHAPTLAERVRALVGIESETAFRLSKGAVACVETEDGRSGLLKFLVTPKLLGI